MSEKWWPLTGAAGIGFVILFLVGFAVQGDVPAYNEEGREIADWFADNGSRYLVGDFIIALGFILLYPAFLLGLTTRLRRAEGDPPILSGAVFLGGLLFPAAGIAGGVSQAGLALLEGDVSAEIASLAAAASFHGFGAAGAMGVIVMGAAAVVIVRTGVFWSWLGWLGAALAAVSLVGAASVIENNPDGVLAVIGLVGFAGFGIWMLVAGIALWRTPAPAAS